MSDKTWMKLVEDSAKKSTHKMYNSSFNKLPGRSQNTKLSGYAAWMSYMANEERWGKLMTSSEISE